MDSREVENLGQTLIARGDVTSEAWAAFLAVAGDRPAAGAVEEIGEELVEKGLLSSDRWIEITQELAPASRPTRLDAKVPGPSSSRDVQPDPAAGQMIGAVRIEREIGRGGMGQVYLGHHERLDRSVVVKVLRQGLDWDESVVKRFRREARACARLQHPHIVGVYDVDQTQGGQHYLVLEYVPGTDLDGAMRARGSTFLPEEALSIVRDVASALGVAHERGIIHRDIKPGNVLISEQGEVKVTDFGLALDTWSDERLSSTGVMMGTPSYMSPEQWESSNVGPPSDVYSLGVLFFWLLTGQKPYGEGDAPSILKRVIRDPVPSLKKHRADFPPEFDRVVRRMLAKSPDDRYRSIPDLDAELRALAEGAPLAAASGADRLRWGVAIAMLAIAIGVWAIAFRSTGRGESDEGAGSVDRTADDPRAETPPAETPAIPPVLIAGRDAGAALMDARRWFDAMARLRSTQEAIDESIDVAFGLGIQRRIEECRERLGSFGLFWRFAPGEPEEIGWASKGVRPGAEGGGRKASPHMTDFFPSVAGVTVNIMRPRPGSTRSVLPITGARRVEIFSPRSSTLRVEVEFTLPRSFDRGLRFFLDLPSTQVYFGLKVVGSEPESAELIVGLGRRDRSAGANFPGKILAAPDVIEANEIGPASEFAVGPTRFYSLVLSGEEDGLSATLTEKEGAVLWEVDTPWLEGEREQPVHFGLAAPPDGLPDIHLYGLTVAGRR